jgi:hypothetical protein
MRMYESKGGEESILPLDLEAHRKARFQEELDVASQVAMRPDPVPQIHTATTARKILSQFIQ